MTAKKIKDYINKSVRRIKHRKGFGVHSPFAYSIITDVIEEKSAYYAYSRINRTYSKATPISFKVACLLLRLANRFKARKIVEIGCDGGFSLLPLILTDSRNEIVSLAKETEEKTARNILSWLKERIGQVSFVRNLSEIPEDFVADMVLITALPDGFSEQDLFQWLKSHSHENTIFFIKGIQPKRALETVWDCFCDDDNIEITMDMYDYGLAIRRPRFFKQHYIVAF